MPGLHKDKMSLDHPIVQNEQMLKNGDMSKGLGDVNGKILVVCRAFPPMFEIFYNKMLEISKKDHKS